MASKKILELNPHNAVVKDLNRKLADDKADKSICDLTFLLFETTLLTSGVSLDHSKLFENHIHLMIALGLDVDKTEELAPALSTESPVSTEAAYSSAMEENE